MSECYVLSIKKEYGMNLLHQKAFWEYRRRKSRIQRGDRIILYATAPDKEFIGEFIVGEIVIGTPREVWERTEQEVCYSREEVVPYLESGNFPIAFQVTSPRIYSHPLALDKMPLFKPPMSYCRAPEQLFSMLS